MGIAVSRIVQVHKDVLSTNKDEHTARWEVLKLWGRIPLDRYKVTFILDNKGHFLVIKKKIMVIKCRGRVHKHCTGSCPKGKLEIGACFLPKSWDGKKVRREIKIIRYENGSKSVG